jgi:hypothetical protein
MEYAVTRVHTPNHSLLQQFTQLSKLLRQLQSNCSTFGIGHTNLRIYLLRNELSYHLFLFE